MIKFIEGSSQGVVKCQSIDMIMSDAASLPGLLGHDIKDDWRKRKGCYQEIDPQWRGVFDNVNGFRVLE